MIVSFDAYLAQVAADLKGGKATEHTYRPALKDLLESLEPGIQASNDPKHIDCGAPDFIVERRHAPLGYVETKDIDAKLDTIEKSDQLVHYRAALNNLILTDYLEFRWYVNGAHRLTTRIATVGENHQLVPDPEGIAKAAQLFAGFYQTTVPILATPQDLAQRMAALAQITRDLIVGSLRGEGATGIFHKQLEAFRQHLLPALTPDEFADIYAQTMAYGLFTARLNYPLSPSPKLGRGDEGGEGFTRAQAYHYLPPANPFLRKLFQDVGEELEGTPIAPFLDDLAALLARADMAEILRDFGKRTRTEDPVVHFYETFLAAYDPKLREGRGVYYTPEPVVHFIVHSVDHLLKTHFNKPLGLADSNVLLLDPATGTATFLYYVIQLIYDTLQTHGQSGVWKDYVREKLLPRIFGFELLMAPYAVAHLKLGLLLSELGYPFGKHERLGVYLTNTLEQGVTYAETLGLSGYLSDEGSQAAQVKNQTPIMVVLGNPPYSGHSANKGEWIGDLVRDYYAVDGQPLGERNPKWLQDDYVKFIRFAQWRIAQTGQGIVAFVTNHGYLDNPTFRGMRQQLLNAFDEIYVLDLHGNTKKKETAPDGSQDENVFDIQQGVAILLAIKHPPSPSPILSVVEGERGGDGGEGCAHIHHAHLYGLRKSKYQFLASHDVSTVKWTELKPAASFYLFVPQSTRRRAEYERGWKINDMMPVNSVGIVTGQDAKTIASTSGEARKLAHSLGLSKETIKPILYRPFDMQYIVYDKSVVTRPRQEIMYHLVEDNLGLITVRQVAEGIFNHVFVTPHIVESRITLSNKGIGFVFPLYLYPNGDFPLSLFADADNGRRPNLAAEFIAALAERLKLTFVPDGAGDLKKTFGPADVFHYAYAVFHSPTYRTRYAEFLKMDFPRLPLTSDRKLFAKLAARGAELVSLHLLKSPVLDVPVTTFPVSGDNTVDKISPCPTGRGAGVRVNVYINATQYFGGVPEAVWEFHIGGYQVCHKWLKDRKGRTLVAADIAHYQRIVVALKETIRLMAEIDKAIPTWPIE